MQVKLMPPEPSHLPKQKPKSEVDSNLGGSPPPLLCPLVTLSGDRGQAPSAAWVHLRLSDMVNAKTPGSPVKLGQLTFLVAGKMKEKLHNFLSLAPPTLRSSQRLVVVMM